MVGSLRCIRWGLLAALVASAASSGCSLHDHGAIPMNDPSPSPVEPQQVTIDADATLEVKAGEGVGVFIEYATGGHWRVRTTCDSKTATNPQGVPCGFDMFAMPAAPQFAFSNVQGQALSAGDGLEYLPDGTIHFYSWNTDRVSGIAWDGVPGVGIDIAVDLDGRRDPRFLYWVGNQVLHQGAPTNPLALAPSEAAASSAPEP